MRFLTLAIFHVVLLGSQTLADLRYCSENEELLTSDIEMKKRSYYTREAELMVLESTNSLLPDQNLVRKIRYDMKTIRSNYPAVANITHRKKWSVGKLRFQNVATEDMLRVNQSEYGPVKVRILNPRYRAVETVMNITYITFSKPYHPIVLAQKLEEAFGISGDPIRSIFQDGDDTLYMYTENTSRNRDLVNNNGVINVNVAYNSTNNPVNNNSSATPPPVPSLSSQSNSNSAPTVYTFVKGKGKCFIACEHKRYWNFMVQCINQRNLDVTLMQEYNVNLKSASNLNSLLRLATRK